MKDYHGNRTPYLYALYHESDRTKVLSVLEAMDGRGFAFCGAEKQNISYVKKALAILAFLSADFYADEAKQNEFFAAKDSGVPLIPILLDDSPMPEIMMQAMYAKNSLIASRYPTDKALAERILTAEAFRNPTVTPAQKKASRTGLIGFCAAAAAVLVAGVLILTAGNSSPAPEMEEVIDERLVAFGLTQKDLEEIQFVRIAGDSYTFEKTNAEAISLDGYTRIMTKNSSTMANMSNNAGYMGDMSYLNGDAHTSYDELHWDYNGTSVELTEYDLDFLPMLPNLKAVNLVMVKADALPELGGLNSLEELNLYDCDIPDISTLEGSSVQKATLKGNSTPDYSPLNQCLSLKELTLELQKPPCDLSTIAPPNLTVLTLSDPFGSAGLMDFSGMRDNSKLESLKVSSENLTDLTGIRELTTLKNLELIDNPNFTTFAGISKLVNLEKLYYSNLIFSIRKNFTEEDAQEIGQCTKLTLVDLISATFPTAEFLNNLPKLTNIDVITDAADIAFLNQIEAPKVVYVNSDFLTCSEPIKPQQYDEFYLNFFGNDSDIEAIGEYLKDADIHTLSLWNMHQFGDAQIPKSVKELELVYCTFKNITFLPNGLNRVKFFETSVADWSELEKHTLDELTISTSKTLPDFSKLTVRSSLTLENIPRLQNLNCLEDLLNRQSGLSLYLPGNTNLKNISLLESYHGGMLGVPEHLDREGRRLVESGNFQSSEIVFPELATSKEFMQLTLESMEDLSILTEEELAPIEKLSIAGDALFDDSNCYVSSYGGSKITIRNWRTGEEIQAGEGIIHDFSLLEKLPNLKSLVMYSEPLTSLEGIQKMENLEQLTACNCTRLTDISAAFTLPKLTGIDVSDSPVASIEGIQNLSKLEKLDISNTKVSDLSPLEQCRPGELLELDVMSTNIKDLTPLRNFRSYTRFDVGNTKVTAENLRALFTELDSVMIHNLGLSGLNLDQETFDLILSKTHGLYTISLNENMNIQDLSALMQQDELKYLYISSGMPATEKLREMNPSFEINEW